MSIDLVLVNPSVRKEQYGSLAAGLAGIEPPIWCALAASYVRSAGYAVSVIDMDPGLLSISEAAGQIAALEPALTAIMVMGSNPSASSTPKMPAAGRLARALKKAMPAGPVALCGLHPSALTERTLLEEEADYVIKGEPFIALAGLLKNISAGKSDPCSGIRGVYGRGALPGRCTEYSEKLGRLDELGLPAWDLVPMDKYRAHNWHCFGSPGARSPYAVLFTGMGCPFSCSYCPVSSFFGDRRVRYRSLDTVTRELDMLSNGYGIKNIKIADELFTLDNSRAEEIADMIAGSYPGLNIWAYARPGTVDMPLLIKLKRAGFSWLCYGFETSDPSLLADTGKKTPQDSYGETIRMTREAGINIIANFIFGLPGDTPEKMRATLDFARRNRFEYVNFYTCMAYPGSRLYRDREGCSWSEYSQYSSDSRPDGTDSLGPGKITGFRDNAFREYFSDEGYISYIRDRFGAPAEEQIRSMLEERLERNAGGSQ